MITDTNGCSKTIKAEVSANPEPITVVAVITPSSCSENDGSIVLIPSGGEIGAGSDYNYLWNNGVALDSLGSGSGIYSVTVSDDNNCSYEKVYAIQY